MDAETQVGLPGLSRREGWSLWGGGSNTGTNGCGRHLKKESIDFFVFFSLSLILNARVLPSTALGTKEVQAMLDSVYHFGADFSLSIFHPRDTEAGGNKLRPRLLLHTFHVNRWFGLISLCKRYNQSYDRILGKRKFKRRRS